MKTNKAKRLFVAIVTMLLLPVMAAATPATLSIEEFTISAGETKEMIIDLNNPSDQITLVQFDLQLPEGLSITLDAGDMIVDIVPGRTTTRKHSISANYQAENNITRVLLSSNTNATFSGTSGAIISISLTASSTFNGGTVKLKNQLLVTPSAVETKPADYSYTISGSAPETLEPYAVLSSDYKTLTFYYDNLRTNRAGMALDIYDENNHTEWSSHASEITTVVFDISFAKCSSITSTSFWFSDCSSLTSIVDIQNLKTTNVTDMSCMFLRCINLASLDVSHFDTKNVIKMNGMFASCNKLGYLDLSNFDTSKVTDMNSMFYYCNSLTSLDLSSFNTLNVTAMYSMFQGCEKLTSLNISNFNTTKVVYMDNMFSSCKQLEYLDLRNFDTSSVTTMREMFWGCESLISLDVSNFNTSKVTNMIMMFYCCYNLPSLDISSFDTNKVTKADHLFAESQSLIFIYVGDGWSVNNMSGSGMFTQCNSIVGQDETTYNKYADGISKAHYGTGGYLRYKGAPETYAVVSSNHKTLTFFYDKQKTSRGGKVITPYSHSSYVPWSTYKNEITNVVFDNSFAENTITTSTAHWFSDLNKLSTITGIQNLKTNNVKNMSYMFYNCGGLYSLDLSNFSTNKVTNMSAMFYCCYNVGSIYVGGGWDVSNITSSSNMFTACYKIVGQDGTTYNGSGANDVTMAHYGTGGYLRNSSDPGYAITIDATNFPDENFRNWVLAQTYGADGVLTDEEIASIKNMYVYNKGITDLKGIEYFTALEQLHCYKNNLTTLDVSKNTALKDLHCNNNNLTTLNVSKNTELTWLCCSSNQLSTLDVSKNIKLGTLDCDNNNLTILDVSKNTALYNLDCFNNNLSSLDLSKNTAIKTLKCYANRLYSLDLSKNTALKSLYCWSNLIKETEMGHLVESLPTVNNGWFVVFFDDGTDENVITTTQVATAKAKGWIVKYTVGDNWYGDYYGVKPTTPTENITFADAKVKALCVANWDTNGDGELSKAEAAAVTDLGQVFKNNTEITSFDELQYFTGLTKIYNQYFFRCTNLQRITIPNSVTIITANSFYFTENLASIIVAEGNTKYDSRNNCNAIISSSTNTLIVGCKNTIIPNSVTIIGSDSFWGCRNLNNITIPNSITTIQSDAFRFCSGLTSIMIPNSVNSISGNAFIDCSSLSSIAVASGNTKYDSRSNCNAIIETSTNTLITGCKNTVIPNNIVAIGNSAFGGCTGLTSMVLPSSLTSIGEYVFDGCNSLASINIPSNVSTIGRASFQSCTNLTSVTLPNSLTKIEPWTFNACKALTAISIPELVSDIEEKAFYQCNNLTSVTVKNPVPANVVEDAFPYRTNATLYVPVGSKGAYQAATYWRDFKNIVETSTGIESVNSETITDNRYYTLDGRLVENPDKGIYIVNGHKVVIK